MVSGTHGVRSVEKLLAAHRRQRQIMVSCAVLGRPIVPRPERWR